MFDRILIPLDGSPFAEAAFPAAIAVAEHVGGQIRLMTVRPHLWADEAEALERALDQEAWAYLADATARVLAMTAVPVSSDMRRGGVPEEIVAEAQASHDLVVMTSHGRGGISRIWLGSVTDACLRGIEKPVLVVRPPESGKGPSFAVDRVVVPLDGSTVAESALPIAVSLADAFGAYILLVRTVPVPLDTAFFPAPDWVPTDPRELVEGARGYLERIAEGIETSRGRPRVHVEMGRHPALAIKDAAGTSGLVAMAAHAHGGLRRAVLGSVTDKVVRTSEGAVLVVRPQHSARDAPAPKAKPAHSTRG